MAHDHALYRLYDESGQLLYVGISVDPGKRLAQHRSDKKWWSEVSNITIQPMATRKVALAAEREAIKDERPVYNLVHNEPLAIGGLVGLIMVAAESAVQEAVGSFTGNEEAAAFIAGVVLMAMREARESYLASTERDKSVGSDCWDQALEDADSWIAHSCYDLQRGEWRAA